MLTEICAELRNYFLQNPARDVHVGIFKISDGTIAPLHFLQNGQYFRIIGSAFNDGVYCYPATELTDEEFDGAIWAMSVPQDIIKISEEIKAFTESDAGKMSPYTSESWGGYSYSKATNSNGAPISWQTAFSDRLNKYRRIRAL